jgi:tetratricopeptide (TPR) repeat protein
LASDYYYYGKLYAKSGSDSLATIMFIRAYELDTTNIDALNDIATSYNKMKKYDEAAIYYQKKIATGSATSADWMSLGKAYFNAKNYPLADTTFAQLILIQPLHVQAWRFRALTNVQIDTTSKLGLAKPYYLGMISAAQTDSIKYVKELQEAYSYFSYYYFKQFNMNKKRDDAIRSVEFCRKILAIVPNDENAKTILKTLQGKY